jgi:two-component system, NarL family, response regulator NreC
MVLWWQSWPIVGRRWLGRRIAAHRPRERCKLNPTVEVPYTKPVGAIIRIILVDDHQLFRAGLRSLLAVEPAFEVVAEAGDAREACTQIAAVDHDLVVVDVTLPGSNGIALIRELERREKRRPVLVLTMHQHADFVIDAFAAGANGYALKLQSEAEIFEAIRTTAGGGRYVAPVLAEMVRGSEQSPQRSLLGSLSAREREIFDLLVRGYTNAEVAKQLFISIKTVETHRTRILRKLDVHNIGDLVRLAARHGLIAA